MPFILNMHDCYIEAETHFLLKRARLVLALVIPCIRSRNTVLRREVGADVTKFIHLSGFRPGGAAAAPCANVCNSVADIAMPSAFRSLVNVG